MQQLTQRQQKIFDFIRNSQELKFRTPSLREIAAHFDTSLTAAADHVRALIRKGYVKSESRRARSLQIVTPFQELRKRIVDIPLYGSIPAGFADNKEQEAKACISVDVETLGIKPTARTFALEVKGESMIGKHILPGDFVICEHGLTPKPGDVVAALIDRESTLKTFVTNRGKPCLKAENPKFPKLIPAEELVIQGVMIALVRKGRSK